MTDGIFPDQLKIARVTPIHKAGDTKCLTNYRPISVLLVFSKISEKLVYKRLLDYLNKHDILSKNQFGFRSMTSTSMALLKLVDDLSRVLDDLFQRLNCKFFGHLHELNFCINVVSLGCSETRRTGAE